MENSYLNAFLFEKGNFHIATYSKESDAKDGYVKDVLDARAIGTVIASEIAFAPIGNDGQNEVKLHLKNKAKLKK